MNRWLVILLGGWALVATIASAWMAGRDSAATPPAANATRASHTALGTMPKAAAVPAPSPSPSASPTPRYPDYASTIPKAFRGRWDEMTADRCEGREARFAFGTRQFENFEAVWEVTKVKLYSPTEIDLHTTSKDENANQVDEVWEFKLVDGGKTLTGRKKGATFFRRCP